MTLVEDLRAERCPAHERGIAAGDCLLMCDLRERAADRIEALEKALRGLMLDEPTWSEKGNPVGLHWMTKEAWDVAAALVNSSDTANSTPDDGSRWTDFSFDHAAEDFPKREDRPRKPGGFTGRRERGEGLS